MHHFIKPSICNLSYFIHIDTSFKRKSQKCTHKSTTKSAPKVAKTLGDLFSSVQNLGDRFTRYLCLLVLVGESRYPMELMQVNISWPRHHGHIKNKK